MSTVSQDDRLRTIIGVAGEIAATRPDTSEIIELVAERATSLTGAQVGAVELADTTPVPAGDQDLSVAPGLSALGSLAGLALALGRPLRCDDALADDRMDPEACRQLDVRSMICVPLRHRTETVGALQVMSPDPGAFDDGDMETLHLLGGVVAAHLTGAARVETEAREGYEDTLTGLPGGRVFETALRGEVARAHRYGMRLSLALFDVDQLDRVNHVYGRDTGDAVLQRVSEVLRAFRAGDLAFRVGYDEFAVLLPNTASDSARTAAERAALSVGPCGLPPGLVRVSVGVVEAGSADPPGLLRAAWNALIQAKYRNEDLTAA